MTTIFHGLLSYRPPEVLKCSKLKWNHEPQPTGFKEKF